MANTAPPAGAIPVEVNGRTIDPFEHYAQDAKRTDHIILTAKHVLSILEEKDPQDLGVEFLEDLGRNNFLCRFQPTDLGPLRRRSDCIQQVDVYRKKFKIHAILETLIEQAGNNPRAAATTYSIDVMVHDGVPDIDALAVSIAEKANLRKDALEAADGKIRLIARLDQLEAIASDDRVRVLEKVVTPVLDDAQAQEIISSPVRMRGLPGFQGDGQVIAIADSGFDLGSADDCHPAFSDRILKLLSVGRSQVAGKPNSQKVDDPKGHGTHVCGTVLGRNIETS